MENKLKFSTKHVIDEQRFDLIKSLLTHTSQLSFMIKGDPGIGKTAFVREIAQLLGARLIVIEAPHIVAEHIINIPFIVEDTDGQQTSMSTTLDNGSQKTKFKIKFADSNLFTQLKIEVKKSDRELIEDVYKNETLSSMWEALGGSEEIIPRRIKQWRAKHSTILFVDEFWRQTQLAIRNILRGILNGDIGSHRMPDHVYEIYASNENDGSSTTTQMDNENFKQVRMEEPAVDAWFSHFYNKHKDDQNLNPDLLNFIYEFIKTNTKMVHAGELARLSPRRWEQWILAINSELPPKNARDVSLLLKTIHMAGHDYEDESQKAEELVQKFVEELAKFFSNKYGVAASHRQVHNKSWRELLLYQIKLRRRLGSKRTYIPVVAGLPGVGKTKHIAILCEQEDLVPIMIDCTRYNDVENMIGTPLSDIDADDNLNVEFGEPPLYIAIMSQIKQGEKELFERLRKYYPDEADARIAKYRISKVKYLIFFDELNRIKTDVYNALRRVLLEKKFDDNKYSLPKESLIVGAINPAGSGASQFTQHVRDVMDIIPASIDWDDYLKHVEDDVIPSIKIESGQNIKSSMIEVLHQFMDAFGEKFKPSDETSKNNKYAHERFFFHTPAGDGYLNSRQITSFYEDALPALCDEYEDLLDAFSTDEKMNSKIAEEKFRRKLWYEFSQTILDSIARTGNTDSAEFEKLIKEWVMSSSDLHAIPLLFNRKVKSISSLETMMDEALKTPENDLYKNPDCQSYFSSTDPNQIRDDIINYYQKKIPFLKLTEGVEPIDRFKYIWSYYKDNNYFVKKYDADKKVVIANKGDNTSSLTVAISQEIIYAAMFNNVNVHVYNALAARGSDNLQPGAITLLNSMIVNFITDDNSPWSYDTKLIEYVKTSNDEAIKKSLADDEIDVNDDDEIAKWIDNISTEMLSLESRQILKILREAKQHQGKLHK